MSTNNGYLPIADKEKVVWLKNFSAKLSTYSATIGLTAAEVTATANDSIAYTYAVDLVEYGKNEVARKVAFKNLLATSDASTPLSSYPVATVVPTAPQVLVQPGVFKRVAKLVQRIKNHPNYNEPIGLDLGIIAADHLIDPSTMKPEIKGAYDAGRPLIKWKKGHADSIDIYVDRNDGKGFTFLANDSHPDYVDTYSLVNTDAAIWAYKAIYKIKDEHVGEFSDIISVTATKSVAVA